MNTNVYGAPPNNMLPPQFAPPQSQPPQQQQQQLPPQQFTSQPLTTTNLPPPSAGNQMSLSPMQTTGNISGMPTSSNDQLPRPRPPSQQQQQQQSILNGNYQQLTTEMSGLAINPQKLSNVVPPLPPQHQQQQQQQQRTYAAPPPMPAPGPYSNQNSAASIPPQQKPVSMAPNNNNFAPPIGVTANYYANGPVQAPHGQQMPPTNYPISTSAAGMSPIGNPNQMTINSGHLQGLPHMPTKAAAVTATTGHSYPPTSQIQQPLQQAPMMITPSINQQPQQAYTAQSQFGHGGIKPPMPGYPPQPGTSYTTQQQQQTGPGYLGQQPPQPGAGYPGQQQQNMGYPGDQMPPAARPGFNQLGNMYQQSQPQRRLDPDQMPNPIQVMIENQRNAGGPFVTNQAGLLPPLVTTDYVVQDQGNCSPRYLRSTLYTLPATADLQKSTALPFSLIVSPFAKTMEGEFEPPIVDFGALGPIRCNRCKAYMSPNMQFIDAGRRFQCLMCKVSTEVPTEYFQHLDHTGQRVDKYERPELVLGTYEFLATKDYCRNNVIPEVPAFIFIIDVSYNTIKSGLVHLLCSQMKQIIKHLPVDNNEEKSKVRIGFITYNSSVHFYNIHPSLAQPQMMVVGDVHDMFMPLLNGFLCHPEESEAVIDALMAQIPKMFVDTKETETILYPAIQAGLEALKASNCTGKLLVFNSTLPIADAPGKLKNREDRKLLGTDKEKTILTPQCSNYNQLGHECVQNGVSVDLFVFNNSYIDIATIGQVTRLTGGEVFKYTYFQADTDGKRLIEDIKKNISRPIAFDAVMRVRTSTGIRATDFYGHFFMTNTTDVELASIDSTKAIAVEIKHDDKLSAEENVYLQIALLYTSCGGQRRLRIFNLALRVSTLVADVFKTCDLDAMMLFFAKQACFKLMELTPKAVKDNVIHRSAQILACYRKHCTSPTSAGQLILPECLKLLPLYASCLLKNDAISGGSDMTVDERSYVIQFLLAMDLNLSVNFLYPRFIPLHNLVDDTSDEFPLSIRCTHEKMSEDGAYILENGVFLFVWLGQSLPQNFIQPLFGVQCTQQVNPEKFILNTETPLGQRIQNIIETIMSQRTRYMRITCVRQNDKLEHVFRHFLVEDRGSDGSSSYVDFLCHMHKEIKDLLS